MLYKYFKVWQSLQPTLHLVGGNAQCDAELRLQSSAHTTSPRNYSTSDAVNVLQPVKIISTAKQAVLFSKHWRSEHMLHKHQGFKAINTLHRFISAEASRIQERNDTKSIHRSIYSPSEIIYSVSLPKPYLRLSLTRHIPNSSSDLECRTQDPQPTNTQHLTPAISRPGTA